jgi:predicted amidophosphoribosyltransferase
MIRKDYNIIVRRQFTATDLCDDCGKPLPNDTGTYCPNCGAQR